jgi:hypothetical protein
VLVVGWRWRFRATRLSAARMRKYGRRTKGPELVTAAQFNGAGVSNRTASALSRASGARWRIFIAARRQDGAAAARAGKLALHDDGRHGRGQIELIRQILMQVEGRGETAIVYDPALEYTPQFYEPGRGDVILNPLDARMPYWSPCDEVQHEAEAEGLAAALFKDDPRTNPFFVMVPRQIFAHLLIEQPKRTPQELLAILRDERELSKRLKDTEHAAAISSRRGTPARRHDRDA